MNNAKPTLGILLEFGFHEIKKYITNDFAKQLSVHFNLIWLARDKQSQAFNAYFESAAGRLIFFSDDFIQTIPNKWESRNKRIRSAWMLSHNFGAFHNHKRLTKATFKSAIIGNIILKKLAEKQTLNVIRRHYQSASTAKFLSQLEIDILFTTGTQSAYAKTVISNAFDLNIPCYYLINSWKDLYIDDFIPFTDFKAIFTWDHSMSAAYRSQLPYLQKTPIIATGNPTFDVLRNLQPTYDLAYYQNKYTIPADKQILLYTMMPVGIARDEMDTIIFMAGALEKAAPNWCILVRKNPTHQKHDFEEFVLPSNLRICEHFCAYDEERDMITQSKEGEQEWLDLLVHSAANASVPSTVSLEFLALQKPVFNCRFNMKNEIDHRLDQFFDAGFYRPLFDQKKVMEIATVEALIAALTSEFDPPKQIESSSAIQAIINELTMTR